MALDDAHDLIPDELLPSLPKLYSTEKEQDPVVHVKFFTPDSSWTWYLTEYDPEEKLAFGLVDGFEREFGYFSLEEMQEMRGKLGLPIERDLHWKPTKISEIE